MLKEGIHKKGVPLAKNRTIQTTPPQNKKQKKKSKNQKPTMIHTQRNLKPSLTINSVNFYIKFKLWNLVKRIKPCLSSKNCSLPQLMK